MRHHIKGRTMMAQARSSYADNVSQFTRASTNYEPGQFMMPGTDTLFATFASKQREMLDFVTMRLEKDSELIRELGACRNWADALTVHSRWVQETIHDYTAEASKLFAFSMSTEQQEGARQRGR
jgi:hypothetical protein